MTPWKQQILLNGAPWFSLAGYPPFNDQFKPYTRNQQIVKGLYKFLSPFWDPISNDGKNTTLKLLNGLNVNSKSQNKHVQTKLFICQSWTSYSNEPHQKYKNDTSDWIAEIFWMPNIYFNMYC